MTINLVLNFKQEKPKKKIKKVKNINYICNLDITINKECMSVF